MKLRTLYPELQPYSHGFLRVSEIHEIYYEECGNPHGKPAVFLHGGPGIGADERSRRFFNPNGYRIIIFDQRGCGRSHPLASIEQNNTWHLIEDLEKLRQFLAIDSWLVFGGSWGSTLALLYAQKYPTSVSELILRGIFLVRKVELEWIYQQGANIIFPDRWEHFVNLIPPGERHDLLRAYYRRLTGDNHLIALEAAKAWSIWEAAISFLIPNEDAINKSSKSDFALTIAKIETHYFVNNGFLDKDNKIIDEISAIRHIPTVIVQGRYDVMCPVATAWDLHKAWPEADFRLVPDAGHSAFEHGMIHELVSATDGFLNNEYS